MLSQSHFLVASVVQTPRMSRILAQECNAPGASQWRRVQFARVTAISC